ncbi:MAG: type II secretion system protein [Candidatus Paceibacterota bacterium]|jgi:prepilin-type N-terminal cleavage/methylation domain-containing protein
MKMNLKKGFTLIELLVVVAIIGILASVVLASLNTARTKGKDASAKASMTSMRAEAELVVDSSGNYPSTLCGAAGQLNRLIVAVNAQIPAAGAVNCDVPAAAPYSAWAAEATLNDGTIFCVDSAGFSGVRTGGKGADATVCAAS